MSAVPVFDKQKLFLAALSDAVDQRTAGFFPLHRRTSFLLFVPPAVNGNNEIPKMQHTEVNIAHFVQKGKRKETKEGFFQRAIPMKGKLWYNNLAPPEKSEDFQRQKGS